MYEKLNTLWKIILDIGHAAGADSANFNTQVESLFLGMGLCPTPNGHLTPT